MLKKLCIFSIFAISALSASHHKDWKDMVKPPAYGLFAISQQEEQIESGALLPFDLSFMGTGLELNSDSTIKIVSKRDKTYRISIHFAACTGSEEAPRLELQINDKSIPLTSVIGDARYTVDAKVLFSEMISLQEAIPANAIIAIKNVGPAFTLQGPIDLTLEVMQVRGH